MAKELRIRASKHTAITISRAALKSNRLVYIATANRLIKYAWGRSAIVYIGTTELGADRIAASAAFRAKTLLDLHGVKTLHFHVVTCKARPNVRSWARLEEALLLTLRSQYGGLPKGNKKGAGKKKALRYFKEGRLRDVVEQYRQG